MDCWIRLLLGWARGEGGGGREMGVKLILTT